MNNKVIVELPTPETKRDFKLILLMLGKTQKDVLVNFILDFNKEHRSLLAQGKARFKKHETY